MAFGPNRGLSGHRNNRRLKRSDFQHLHASVWDLLVVSAQAFGQILDCWVRMSYHRPALRASQAGLASVSHRRKVEKGHIAGFY